AGHPYGKSPHGGEWGQTPWDQAMRLPGSAQVALVRKVLAQYDWPNFRPHPEWAAYDDASKQRWGPFCSGIDGKVRVIYFPSTDAAPLRALPVGAYGGRWISPITGETVDAGELHP